MTNMICNECETVAHCMKNGCVPKTTKKDEAMKLALEALEAAVSDDQPYIVRCKEAITALREALAEQPAQTDWEAVAADQAMTIALLRAEQPAPVREPVAWMQDSIELYVQDRPSEYYTIPLYTSPPAQRKPLTDEEIWQVWGPVAKRMFGMHHLIHTMDVNGIRNESMVLNLARAIEAKLKEKNCD